MSPLGSVSPLHIASAGPLAPIEAPRSKITAPVEGAGTVAAPGGFGQMLDGLVGFVDGKQDAAQAMTQRVLLGDTGQLHQSVIAMQEASVAFTLMVEVRNKLIESYQELMRLQV